MDLNLSFDLRVEPLSKYHLDDISMHRLRGGENCRLDDQYTFLQRIPRSHYVLAVGPVPYLYYLHQMRLLDIALIAFIAISLAFPVFYLDASALAGYVKTGKQRRNDLAMGISMNVSTLMRVRALNDLASHLTRWRTISTP
ncbi:two component sensor kinase [Escherichia coli]|uniref:Two component sensor kinase n=1 Tax=Escherichia coli TaxID=562 RepID=A0A377BL44_ECOLX|nr:two component sensor kinase [Escherichia coli]